MGRQIHFYMLPEDEADFVSQLRTQGPVSFVTRDSDVAEVQSSTILPEQNQQTVVVWSPDILADLQRKWVSETGYYRIDTLHLPVLEWTRSLRTIWENYPALVQGRLFGNFESYLQKPKEFESWYDDLAKWIRRNYRKNPASTGGYLAPAAAKFAESGCYLLPNFVPPKTREWITEIGKQRSAN